MENIEFNNAPVLLITYKRPENTEKLLKILLENKIKNIFIYNNGPINKGIIIVVQISEISIIKI